MSEHDYNIANQSFPSTRTDLNSAFSAIKSCNSKATAPTTPTPAAGLLWFDTANTLLKVHDGTSFVTLGTTYAAGTGLDLTTTTFSVEPDLRDVTHIGLDSGDYITWTNNTHTSFFVNSNEEMRLESDGDLHVDGTVIANSTTISDERLKTGITTVTSALDKVTKLKGVEFTRKNNGQRSAGVIAQDVEKVLPQAVVERALPLQTGEEDTLYKTVDYDALHSLYIEAIKELKDMVEKQALEIKELKGT